MNLLTGLFRSARKRVMTTDNDMGMFRNKLNELVEQKDTLSDEEINTKIEELKGFSKDLPSDDDKAKLERFLEDFKAVKEQDEATAKEAAGMVADLFEKLDTAAMQDVPGKEEVKEEKTEEKVEESETSDENESTTAAKVVEETKTDDGEENTASDNAEYTLEEIYQFIKQRMAEDTSCKDEESKEEVKEEKKEEVVTDCAPFIPVTMNKREAAGSLGDMFASIKNGGR